MRRVVADNLLTDCFQHAPLLHRAAAGRNNHTRSRGGITAGVRFDVVGDDAQGPGLGRNGRGNVKDSAQGEAAQNNMECDGFDLTASGWVLPVTFNNTFGPA